MNYTAIMDMVRTAEQNLKKIAPDHNPWSGHLLNDPDGKSKFSFENAGNGTIADLLGTASIVDVKYQKSAVLITMDCNWDPGCAGWSVTNKPIPENKYIACDVHGMIQFKGDGKLVTRADNWFTLCLTEEKMPDGTTDLALASIYPGQPDKPYDLSGIKAGDVLTGADLLARGINRVC